MTARAGELFVYLVTDGDGEEGVAFMETASGTRVPLVGTTRRKADLLRPIAERLATILHRDLTLAHYSKREDLEVLGA